MNFVGQRFTTFRTTVLVVEAPLPGIFAVAVTFQHRPNLDPSHSLLLSDGLKCTGDKAAVLEVFAPYMFSLGAPSMVLLWYGRVLKKSMLLLVY